MPSTDPSATVTVKVAAEPAAVYALVTDLDAMAQLAEETAAMRWAKGSAAAVGAVFKGTNRNGWRRWTTTCTVTEAEPGRRFTFDVTHTVVPISRWQYVIEPADGGCTVTESTWDRRPGWFKWPSGLFTGVSNRAVTNTAHIAATLERLKARAETQSTTA